MLSQLSYTPTRLCLVPLVSKLWICQASFSRFCVTESSKLNNDLKTLLTQRFVFLLASQPIFDWRRLRSRRFLLRKEVIQPHLPIRLPCYDFTPVINPTFGAVLLAVRQATSGVTDSHGVTGGVYKARERIHRGMLIRDY